MSCRTTQAWWTVLSDPIMLNDIRSMMVDVKSKNCRDTLNKPVPQQLILDLYRFLFNGPTWFPWPSHGQIPTPLGLITLVYVLINPNIVVWILLFHGFHRFCLKSVTCLVPATIMSPHLCVGFLFLVGHSRAHSFLLLPPAASPPAASHTTSSHTTCSHTTCPHTQLTSTHNLLPHTAYSHTTSLHTTSPHTTYSHTHNLLSHNFLTHNFITHNLSTHNLLSHNLLTLTTCPHTTSSHTHTTSPHNLLTHTTSSHTHNLLSHNLSTHNLLSHNFLTHTTYSHTTSSHTSYSHTQLVHKFCAAGVCTYGTGLALVARLGPVWRRGLGDIDFHFAWQAWHLATSASTLRGRCGTWRHWPSLCMAGAALGDIDCHFAWQAWHLWHWTGSGGALGPRLAPWLPRLFAWQVWHLATSTVTLRGRRGTWRHRHSCCWCLTWPARYLCEARSGFATFCVRKAPVCSHDGLRGLLGHIAHGFKTGRCHSPLLMVLVCRFWLHDYPPLIHNTCTYNILHTVRSYTAPLHTNLSHTTLSHAILWHTLAHAILVHANTLTYIHTCIHTYIHTCIRTYVHTYIRTYVHTCMHAYIHPSIHPHACMHACIHTYKHAYIHTHVRTYVRTYLRTYIHTYIHTHAYTCTHTHSTCI